ncbi:hypothetical protein POUND7_003925 [Theobroma cacao]
MEICRASLCVVAVEAFFFILEGLQMFVARYAIQLPKSLPLSNADGDLGYPDHVSSNQPKRREQLNPKAYFLTYFFPLKSPDPRNDMAQLICGGCRTLLMYTRGATSVRCSCCHTINFAQASNQIAHINCGHCRTTLMYPYGAPSVKCAVCQYVTNVGVSNIQLIQLFIIAFIINIQIYV